MSRFYWSDNVNGDSPRFVGADYMRVGSAGELIFEDTSPLPTTFTVGERRTTPVLIVAPGEWKSAWRDN